MLQIRARVSFPRMGVKKTAAEFFCFASFCKPNKKLFLHMPDIDMVKNVKVNCDLMNESIEGSLQTRKKWILIRKHWYKFV